MRNVFALLNSSAKHRPVETDESDPLFEDMEVMSYLFGDQLMNNKDAGVISDDMKSEGSIAAPEPVHSSEGSQLVGQDNSTRPLYGIYVLQALGDLVVTSQIAKQLKHDEPDSHVVWFVLKKNAFVLKGNPYIDEIVELEGKNSDWDTRVDELKSSRPWTRFLVPQPHLAYEDCPGGDLTELVKAAVKLNWTVPYIPVMRLDEAETARARDYVASLPSGLRILVETEFQSEQSPWSEEYAVVMIQKLRHLNPVFIFSAKNEPAYLDRLRSMYQRIEWCQLPFRENAELYNHMDAFIGVSSGISCLSYSDWCKNDVPHVEVVNNTHWSSFHFTHHTKRRLCFEEQSYCVSLDWLAKVLEAKITGAENPQSRRMDLYVLSHEGKYTHFCKTILPSTYALKEDLRTMAMTLLDFPEFYLVCGNIDDAMLTLSKALDENKLINVIVCSKFFNELKPFFDEHSQIRNVYVIPYPEYRPESQTHLVIQMGYQPNCKGIGMKWSEPAVRQLFNDEAIQRLTGFKANPSWARHRHPKNKTMRVVIEAKGPSVKGYRSERAIINPRWWRSIIGLLTSQGLRPIIVGDAAFSAVYSVDERCEDLRNETTRRQVNELRTADLFISSDSMFLTIAAMYSVKCLRCVPMRGHDLRFYDDPALSEIRRKWTNVQSCDNIDVLLEHMTTQIEEQQGSFISRPIASTTHRAKDISRRETPFEQLSSFHSIFWNRNYPNIQSVLLRCSTAVGDSLMITNVVHALKAQYPHLDVYLSGTQGSLAVFQNNSDVKHTVLRDSVEELLLEATVDEVVEFNHIIDQCPEYYNGIHLQDILGNIAGVKLHDRELHYTISDDEAHFADACMQKFFGSTSKPFVIGLHLFTEKDPQRSFRHASGLIEYLTHMYPDATLINFGQSSFRQSFPQVLDCAKYSNIGLRQQIALAAKCHVFITIDSAFFHVAHNLLGRPTLAIQSVVNEFLTGDPSLGNVRTLRNAERQCRGCYWVPGVCKTDCLATLHPQVVAREFSSMIDDIQSKKMPFKVPDFEQDVRIEYDELGSNMAQVFRANSLSGKNIRPVLTSSQHSLPDYCHQWNGIDVDQSDCAPKASITIESLFKTVESEQSASALSWM